MSATVSIVCDADGAPMFSIGTRDEALGDIPSAGGILRPTLHSILSDRLLFTRVSASAMVAASTTIWLLRLTASIPTHVSSCFPHVEAPRYAGQMCWRLMIARHPAISRRTFSSEALPRLDSIQ
jgi:hypothetical protein